MKKLLLILLCLPFIGFGQGWETTFGGTSHDYGESVQQTTDGGYIITGHTNSFGNGWSDVYLIKTDGNGIQQWNQTFGGTGYDAGYSVQQTTDGGYIITGEITVLGGPFSGLVTGGLIKTDGSGVEQWNQTFETFISSSYSVQQTTDGGYIITGSNSDVCLIKTDGSGDSLWTKTFGGGTGYSVQQTTDGGYIISGKSEGGVYLIKTDGSGDSLWTKTFGGGTGYDAGYSVQQTTDGGYIITGVLDSLTAGGYGVVYLIKTDGNGIEQWSKTFGGTGHDEGWSVQQTTDGGYIITGGTSSFGSSPQQDVYLIKTDGNGIEQWSQTIGGTGHQKGSSVQQTIDGGYIIAGYTNSFGGGMSDVYLIKTDGNGNVTSTFNIPINPNRKLEKVIDILGRDIKQTNQPLFYIYDDGTVEKRIVIE